MSLMSIDHLSPHALVAQYISEVQGVGHFLTRDEMELVGEWLQLANNQSEEIILILDDILRKKMSEKSAPLGKKLSVKSIHKAVKRKLEERNALKG